MYLEYKCFTGTHELYNQESIAQRTGQVYKDLLFVNHVSLTRPLKWEITTVIRDALWQVSDFLFLCIFLSVYYTEKFKSFQEHAFT